MLRKLLIVATLLSGTVAHAQSAGWQDISQNDPLTGKPNTAIALFPISNTDGDYSDTGIIIRCKDNQLTVLINWDKPMTQDSSVDNYDISYRMGNGPVQTETWGLSTDNQSLMTTDTAYSFVENLKQQSQFVVQVIPTGMQAITATYDLTGIQSAVAPVLQACGYAS